MMETYIAQYGYAGIFVGTFFEGETTVLIGGIFAKLRFMDLRGVMLWAFLGTFLGDLTFFSVGRILGRGFVGRHDFLRRKEERADRIIARHGNFIIFATRFLVGIRAVILLLLGCTGLKMSRFLVFNALNSILWSTLVSSVGYLFGNMVFVFVTDIRKYEKLIIPIILVLVVLFIVVYRHLLKKKEKSYGDQ
jgi:membrane protein DedA with SNARE-associated domain